MEPPSGGTGAAMLVFTDTKWPWTWVFCMQKCEGAGKRVPQSAIPPRAPADPHISFSAQHMGVDDARVGTRAAKSGGACGRGGEGKRVAVWNFGPTHTHLQAEPGHPHLPDALHADPNAYHVPWEVQLSLHCERGRHLDGCKR